MSHIDAIRLPAPDAVQMTGLLGKRLDAMRLNRLPHQEDYHLLWPFQEHCPAGMEIKDVPHPEIARADWQGEFIGTWVAAATLAAVNSGDEALRGKINGLVAAWLATQEGDGYLGTYNATDRWKSWDVWIHAHGMVGLMHYYRHMGRPEALAAAVRMADLILREFGPGRRSLGGGLHGGMASSAILEPVVWLYFETGDRRYLDFGRWLADEDWEAAGGPAILSSLAAGRGVAGTANGKGVEMLLDFAGLIELYRATGEARYLSAVLTAWDDIARHQLYITGSASSGEHFRSDYLLRNDGYYMVGETCVTMAWMYVNLAMGRLTGEARFYDMAEQALYNHLLAAQSPDGRGWAYYTGLRDNKRYRWHTDPECCPTKGSRALAMMPLHIFGIRDDGLAANFYEPSIASLPLPSGTHAKVEMSGAYPFDGAVRLKLSLEQPAQFAVHLRQPAWCSKLRLSLNGKRLSGARDTGGYLVVDRVWRAGDELVLQMEMPVRVAADRIGNPGHVALVRGPLVYAADRSYLPHGEALEELVLVLEAEDHAAQIVPTPVEDGSSVHLLAPVVGRLPADGPGVWSDERYRDLAYDGAMAGYVTLVPFFEAGNRDPNCYREGVWPNYEVIAGIPEFRYLVGGMRGLAAHAAPTDATYQVWLPYVIS